MRIDDADVVTAVREAFDRYEAALMANDVAELDRLFWPHAKTVRYGPTEALYGHDEILAFRKGRDPKGIARRLERVWITAYGADTATAFCEYVKTETGRRGKQTQTWLRFPDGWRIVAAHVSLDPAP